jgi:hypothetical protein
MPRIDGVLNLRPPLRKSSPTVVAPHQVPQYSRKANRSAPRSHDISDRRESYGDHRYQDVSQLRQESKPADDVDNPFILSSTPFKLKPARSAWARTAAPALGWLAINSMLWTNQRRYTSNVDAGNKTSYILTGLEDGKKYYFATHGM